jgi:L-fuconolactonase
MRIDAHQHFWNFNAVRDSWITDDMQVLRRNFLPADLEPLLKKSGIRGCIAVQADQSLDETNFLLKLAKENSFVKGVVGWVDLRSPEVDKQLDLYLANPLVKGFRHIVQGEPKGFLSNPGFIDGVRKLGERKLTYDLLIYHYQLDEALHFLSKTQNVRIVIDHLAKPSIRTGEKTHWELGMAAAATFQNVYCKISGLVTEANWNSWTREQIFPFLDEVLETFGPSRLMYGSDWPVCLLAASHQEQLSVVEEYIGALSSTEQERIMGATAVEFYNI